MAKSRLEPKKIVRYAESNVPRQGISGIPTPRIQRASRRATASDSISSDLSNASDTVTTVDTGGSATPPPPPPPPAPVGETRAFSFDGATELTSSLGSTFGSDVQMGRFFMKGTFTPGWGQTDTGRYTVFSIATPGTSVDRYDVSFVREANGSGYRDYLEARRMSGSAFRSSMMRVSADGNFYSGSMEEVYIEAQLSYNSVNKLIVNGTYAPNIYSPRNNNQSALDYFKTIPSSSLAFSLGGLDSGSDAYYTGSISNFALYKSTTLTTRDTMADLSNDSDVKLYYTFEGTTDAIKGFDLDVVGTETYVSSSR